VGKRVQFDHLVPVVVGGDVRAEASLDRIEGRRLTFTVSVSDASGLVAAGKVSRVVVDRDTFLANAR
jgi:predicted thioesterase